MGMRALNRLALSSLLVWISSAWALAGVAERRAKSEVAITVTQFPDRLDPAAVSNYQHFLLVQTAFDTLIRINASRRPVGLLAKKWTVDETGTLYRIELKPGVRFHDGTPVTAKDVAYSFARHFWPGSKSAVASHLNLRLEGVEGLAEGAIPPGIRVEGERTVSFKLKAPYASFLSVLAMPGFAVLSRGAAIEGRMVGSGPLIPRHLSEEKAWRLERNPRYHDEVTTTKAFTVRLETDFSRMIRSIEAGETDLAIGAPPAEAFTAPLSAGVRLIPTKSLVFFHLFVLPRNPQLQNKEFRRDLAGLIYSVFGQERFRNPSQDFAPFFVPLGVMPRSYYKRELPKMSSAAFAKRWSGAADGKPLRIMLRETYFTPGALAELRATLSLAELDVSLEPLTPQNFQPMLDSGDFDVLSIPYMSNFADPDGFMNYLHPGKLYPADFKPAVHLFDALSRIPSGMNDKMRLDMYAKELRAFEDEWYLIPLFNISMPLLSARGLYVPDTSYRFEAEWRGIYWAAQGTQ